jgi:hypothetical protein
MIGKVSKKRAPAKPALHEDIMKLNSPGRFPNGFALPSELYALRRKAWHKRTFTDDEIIPELHRLIDAWATLYANLANLKLGPTHYDLDELGFFGNLSWWIGFVEHDKGTKLLRGSLQKFCKGQGNYISGVWGKIYLTGDNEFRLSTSGVEITGYENPIVIAIQQHSISEEQLEP